MIESVPSLIFSSLQFLSYVIEENRFKWRQRENVLKLIHVDMNFFRDRSVLSLATMTSEFRVEPLFSLKSESLSPS